MILFIYHLFLSYFCRLTEREKKDREHKKKLLTLAKEHDKARELEKVQRYHMPQDSKDVSCYSSFKAINYYISFVAFFLNVLH